jgi:hypothetical protein
MPGLVRALSDTQAQMQSISDSDKPSCERHEHLDIAARMFREMDMQFWLEKADAALKALSTQ